MVMNEAKIKVVCDAGPLIPLDELNCVDLLAHFEEIIVAEAVEKELEKHRPSALAKIGQKLTVARGGIFVTKELRVFCHVFSLDAGETESLALMKKNPGAIFLTDDASARLVAEQMRLLVHGTIGIIIRAIRRRQKKAEEVLQILMDLPLKSTLYVKPSLLDEILRKVRDEFHL